MDCLCDGNANLSGKSFVSISGKLLVGKIITVGQALASASGLFHWGLPHWTASWETRLIIEKFTSLCRIMNLTYKTMFMRLNVSNSRRFRERHPDVQRQRRVDGPHAAVQTHRLRGPANIPPRLGRAPQR